MVWNNWLTRTAFFIAVGSVCAGPAVGQTVVVEEEEPVGDLFAQADDGIDVAGDDGVDDDQNVAVSEEGRISIQVDNLDITKVLRLLSLQTDKNIVATKNVTGKVSANIDNARFHEALDAILKPNGFGYEERGSFIYVDTVDAMKAKQEAQREMAVEVIRLNWINAADAATFVSPLLSSAGTIAVSAATEEGFQPSLTAGGEDSFAAPPTLVVKDYEENIAEIKRVLGELDRQPKQVLIEATVLQANLTEDNALGVDFSIFADLSQFDFTNPLNAVDELIDGSGPQESGGVITTSGGGVSAGDSSVKIGIGGSDAAVFLRALQSVTDTTVLARPSLTVLDRQKADLLVGAELGYLSTTVTETSQTQTVEFLEVGTQLTVRPYVTDDGRVRMEIRPSVSDGQTRLVGGFIIPDTTTNTLTTNVIVPNGNTIVLGGLFSEDISSSRRSIPGLGDVPIVGWAGKGQDDNVARTEVIFLIKPTVMEDQVLAAIGERAEDDIWDMLPGARRGLLPWSRTRLTAHYMSKAHKHLHEGNDDKALWNVKLALHTDPTYLDALHLREELTGRELYGEDRGLLIDVINSVIDEQAPADDAMEELDAAADVEASAEDTLEDVVETAAWDEATEPVAPADEEVKIEVVESKDDWMPEADAGEAPAEVVEASTDHAASNFAESAEAMIVEMLGESFGDEDNVVLVGEDDGYIDVTPSK